MQSDFYRSPCPDCTQSPVAPTTKPRRKRWKLVLCLFLALIVLTAGGLLSIHLFSPDGWGPTFEDILEHFGIDGSYFPPSEDFFQDHEFITNQEDATITIPRTDPVSNVQLLLNDTPTAPLSYQTIYTKVIPSIVSIRAAGSGGSYHGTGVIMTQDGYVITNHHVIAGCSSAQVVLYDGTAFVAKLAGTDVESDLAVLKIQTTGLTAAEFGNSDLIQVGDVALAIGNPLGSDLFGTMTEGIVSAINRDVNMDGYHMSLIQTTAALNPGNSGGALINQFGQVIGITNMKMMSSYETIEGLGFAIPSVWAKEVVDVLISKGAITGRPTMGIMCRTLLPSEFAQYNCENGGVLVDDVTKHGPSAKAGLRPGDVIIACNGQEITSLETLTQARDKVNVDGQMNLTVIRNGETLNLTITLVEQHELH